MISTPYYHDLSCDSSPYVMQPPPNHRPASYLARKKVLRDGIWRDPEEVFLLSNPYPVFSIGLSSSFLFSPLHLFTSSLLHLLTTITTTSPLPRLLLHQHNNQRKNDGAFSPVSGSAAVSRRPIGILLAFLSIRDSLSSASGIPSISSISSICINGCCYHSPVVLCDWSNAYSSVLSTSSTSTTVPASFSGSSSSSSSPSSSLQNSSRFSSVRSSSLPRLLQPPCGCPSSPDSGLDHEL